MAAIVHLDVTVWMLIRLVEYDDIADLRNIRLWRHDLRAVPLQEWPVIAGIARLRAVCGVQSGGLQSHPAIHGAMMTGAGKRVGVHPFGKLALVQGAGGVRRGGKAALGCGRLRRISTQPGSGIDRGRLGATDAALEVRRAMLLE